MKDGFARDTHIRRIKEGSTNDFPAPPTCLAAASVANVTRENATVATYGTANQNSDVMQLPQGSAECIAMRF